MKYNWKKILKEKSDRELYEIYKGKGYYTNSKIKKLAEEELFARNFNFENVKEISKQWNKTDKKDFNSFLDFLSWDFRLYAINFILIISTFLFFIPRVTTNLNDYQKIESKLMEVKIDTTFNNIFNHKKEILLLLKLKNGQTWKLSIDYSKYWNTILDENNTEKKIIIYHHPTVSDFINPEQIEIDNKIIFDLHKSVLWNYIFIFITIILTIYNVNNIIKQRRTTLYKRNTHEYGYIERKP